MSTFKAAERFRKAMPLNSQIDWQVRPYHKTRQPAELSRAGAKLIHTGTFLLYPADGGPFPGLFESHDFRSGRSICVDTQFCKGERRIALVLEGDYGLVWDKTKMIILPKAQPAILEAFPRHAGWYECEEKTRIPVEDSQASGQARVQPRLFLERERGPWAGCVARSTNSGNHEELYVYAMGSPVIERAVFTLESPQLAVGQAPAQENEVRRRQVPVPASAPIADKPVGLKAIPSKPMLAYSRFRHEWDIQRALHGLDPARCPDPGPVPDKEVFEKLLREGKIRAED